MKRFVRYAVSIVTALLLVGCQSNPAVKRIGEERILGFTPFGVAGGYDVGSIVDYSDENFQTFFTTEYIERSAKPEAKERLHKLFHTPFTPISPTYNDAQKALFMSAIKRTLLNGDFNLSDKARGAIEQIERIDIEVAAAAKKGARVPEKLQYMMIESIPLGGMLTGITAKAGAAKTPVAVSSILTFNQASVTIYFGKTVSAAERREIFDKAHFDDRVTLRLGSLRSNSIIIRYTKPTIVAFKGYRFDTRAARFYGKRGRLPMHEELLEIERAEAKVRAEKEKSEAHARIYKSKTINDTGMINRSWAPLF